MDGYAVRADDVAGASDDAPVHLPGRGRDRRRPGPAAGALARHGGQDHDRRPVPAGADCVVPYEWTDRGVAQVRISQARPMPASTSAVRARTSAEGDLLIEAGTVLGPRHLGLLAGVGRATVRSRPRPRVVILSTGSELREPGTELGRRLDLRRQLLAAGRLGPPRRARSPTASGSSPTSRARSSTR